jgi:NADPH-dependent 2,4-dienoyl-CoA reductase/sulfur reductase-like enzyme
MSQQQAVIVGAGHAGAAAAIELRQAGFAGRIVLVGEETHLPYERPPLSKDLLLAPDAAPTWLHEQVALDEAQVELSLGRRVTAIDRAAARLTVEGGPDVAYDALLLATGGVARRLDISGTDHALTLRTLDDARALQARLGPGLHVAVLGAGVIGLELASSAARLGCQVTVVERQSGPMTRSLDPLMQGWLADLHRSQGVVLEFDADLQAIDVSAQGTYALVLADGREIVADIVVAGIGLTPSTGLASDAGLATAQGVLVDEYGMTSDPAIRAAGDVTSFWHPHFERHVHWQTWQHAQNHGKAVARNMAGAAEAYAPPFWFWTDQHGINVQIAGFPAEGDRTVVRGALTDPRFAVFHLRDGVVVGATLVNNGGMARPVQAMIRSGAKIDPVLLHDLTIAIHKIPLR